MMADTAVVAGSTARRVSRRMATAGVAISGFIFLYYWALLSDGRFFHVKPIRYDLIFNSMIEYMSRGRFDVDPDAVLREGFTRDGRTYSYFGILPALLRLPILLSPRLRALDYTVISCAVAATIAAVAKLGAVLQAGRAMDDVAYRRHLLLFAMAMVIFGGAQVQFLRPSVYQESIFWASAIAAVFMLLAFRWCVEVSGRRPRHLTAMALLAGLCLLTRVSTSIGLYAACAAIMLPEAIAAARRIRTGASIQPASLASPTIILVSFAAICGYINYARWGSPLTFQDYRYYDILPVNDPAFDVLIEYGYFNIRRIPFALSYFFVPVWAIIGSDGHFLFRALQDRLYYTVEAPPATFFASDILLCFLCVPGVAFLSRRRAYGIDRTAARLIACCLLIPGLFMLTAIAVTFRYRLEFYPCFEFLALFGLLGLPGRFAAHPRLFTGLGGMLLAISIVSAHGFLLAYKIAPWGDAAVIEEIGWTAAYHKYLHMKYPGVDRRPGPD
jgi:hypothetical protein